MGFTFWNEWQKYIDLFHDIDIFWDVPVYEHSSFSPELSIFIHKE